MKHLPKEIIINWKKEPQFGGHIIYMSPDEYIGRIHIKNKLSAKEILELEVRAKKAGLKGILYYPPESKTSQDYLKKAMLYGKALDILWIEYDAQGKLRSQEGYNRALAAKSLGIKQIPVGIIKPLKDGKCVKHIDIQKYIIQGVKHYRARVQSEDWKYETNPGETLDMFRNRIMDTLDCGIVTHFLEDWDPMGEAHKHLE